MMKSNTSFIFALILALFIGFELLAEDIDDASTDVFMAEEGYYEVVDVVDGDTYEVLVDGVSEKIRAIGIDTPETKDPRKPVECFGEEASLRAEQELEGEFVKLMEDASQGDRDKYGRLLRYVILEDGRNFNKMLIEEGFAYEYTYNIPYRFQEEFVDAEEFAKENGLGFWGEGVCD